VSNEYENIANFNPLVNFIGSLLAYCNSYPGTLAVSLAVVDSFSYHRDHNGCDSGFSEEHSFPAGENIRL
jgi:hypothetical protein